MQNSNPDQTVPVKPMQIGQEPGQTQELIDEISNTGVIESQDAADAKPGPGADSTQDDAPTIPLPIVARNG